jgi:NAD-dependent dihydropyrimidine dehydrogenase PreA subunit
VTSPLRTMWALLFRLFPCPTDTGLQRIGRPGRDSPVLVTCNFHLTVKRLRAAMRGTDAWLVIADSRGVNVWCAAGEQCRACHEICPVGVWAFDGQGGARLAHLDRCVACRACLEQCPSGSISAPRDV